MKLNLSRKISTLVFGLVVGSGAGMLAHTNAGAADLGIAPARGAVIGSCSEVVLSCENGHQYPVCPIAVSVAGEIVTATLQLSPHHSAYIRLAPMGVGYRYIGKGIWFDGLRENAQLYLSKSSSVSCTVQES